MEPAKPLLLIVLDGWGHTDPGSFNAISQANTPVWHKLWTTCPHTLLAASGLDVGLPAGQMGNSEVGHMTIGSGRVIYQDLTRINLAFSDRNYTNPVLTTAFAYAREKHKNIHLIGLLSPGGVHSHEEHFAAVIKIASRNNISNIFIHAFLDGRDTPPKSAAASLEKFAPYIASITGRFYAMDRDKRVERTNAAVDLLIHGKAAFTASDPLQALQMAYTRGETDEFMQPTQIRPITIAADDVVIFMNFRADRARQLTSALLNAQPKLAATFITLTQYAKEFPVQVAFAPPQTTNTLSDVLARHHLLQLRIAETEKYAHVTFFFNAGREEALPGETRVLIPSAKVTTYDLQPTMSATQITEILLKEIQAQKFDVIVCNFANADMVGHTGNMPATVAAIETIDHCLGQITQALHEFGGQALITADHGNAEIMWDTPNNQPHTAHTTNLVPLIYVGNATLTFKTDKTYGLQDVAPTMLDLLHITKPQVMTGVSLIR